MNDLLNKTTEEIELTIMDGLFNYLKENNYFEKKKYELIDFAKDILWDCNSDDKHDFHIFNCEEELAKELEQRGWRTLNKEENLKPNDLFDEEELEDYIRDNYTIENLVENAVVNYYDVLDYVKDNVDIADLVEYR